MSTRRGIGAAVVAVGVVLLGLGWGSLAAAKSSAPVPPTIAQIQGTWAVSASYEEYDTSTGEQQQSKASATCTITEEDPSGVLVQYTPPGPSVLAGSYYAYCAGGVLMAGAADNDECGSWSVTESWVITGKPGKLTGKGQWVRYFFNSDLMEIGTVTLKQTATH